MGQQVTAVHNQNNMELSLMSRVNHNVISSKPRASFLLGEGGSPDQKNSPSPRSPGTKKSKSPRSPRIAAQPGLYSYSNTSEPNLLMAGGSRIQPIQPSKAAPNL